MELNVITEKRERPFHCGSQAADWEASCCDRCTKRIPENGTYLEYRCNIQRAIHEAQFGDGSVSAEIAARMGYTDPAEYVWVCPEIDWTPEWIAECHRRRTWGYRFRQRWWKTERAVRRYIADRKQKIVEWWRWPTAMKHCNKGTEGCWASWAMWAMGMSDRPEPGSCRSCREKGMSGSCYCGKFISEEKGSK